MPNDLDNHPRRFRTPWSFTEEAESLVIRDAEGYPLAYIYFEDDPARRNLSRRLGKDEARRLAVQIERIPELLKIEKQAKSGNFTQDF